MRIKKHANKNKYLRTAYGMWVRDFTKGGLPHIDINQSISKEEYFMMLQNEVHNMQAKLAWIETEDFFHENVVIVSDGCHFDKLHRILGDLPSQKVTIMGVNGSLKKWAVPQRNLSYYIVNNPFPECLTFLPRRSVSPKCIASTRTNFEFLQLYRGVKYKYSPTVSRDFCGGNEVENSYKVDDYRNPICAAINLANRFGARKIMLLCCDDAFVDQRPGAEQLPNGLWIYPQQRIAHSLIDANLYWLNTSYGKDIELLYHGGGPQFENATYIPEEKILSLFEVKA